MSAHLLPTFCMTQCVGPSVIYGQGGDDTEISIQTDQWDMLDHIAGMHVDQHIACLSCMLRGGAQYATDSRKRGRHHKERPEIRNQYRETTNMGFDAYTHLVRCNNDALFFHTPGITVDLGVELVVPPLSALLANAAREEGGNEAPLPLTILLNQPALTQQTLQQQQHLQIHQ